MNTALTIAGSDSSGGAGIQADIKTMLANGVYAMSAITAITAQNTMGVTGVYPVTPECLAQQIDAVFTDIVPDAVKIGMVGNEEMIRVIIDKLTQYHAKHVVLDPVMVATSGSRLLATSATSLLLHKLAPLAEIITPNIPEAQILSGREIRSQKDMEDAAKRIYDMCGCAVLCKGGHAISDANDYLFEKTGGQWYHGTRIENPNTHGTGCTLSSAIAAYLAKGCELSQAIEEAKAYLTGAIGDGLNLGQGSGPVNHGYRISCDS